MKRIECGTRLISRTARGPSMRNPKPAASGQRVAGIIARLRDEYPGARIALHFSNSFQLLVATILSAQCTDKKVNEVTERLFERYKTARDFARLQAPVLEKLIYSTGFYRAKAGNIIAAAKMIERDFRGEVPDSMEELVRLPGVARKTANVVLCNAFKKAEGIAVDTHVKRLSGRLGFSGHDDPDKIERDLMGIFDRSEWGTITYLLIEHGRAVCDAKKPLCLQCVIRDMCPSKKIFYPARAQVRDNHENG